jgi:hypothetical protein
MRLAIAVALILGLTALAGAQVSAPSVSIKADSWETKNDVVTYSGITLNIDGVEVRADAGEYRDRQFMLRNATVTLPPGTQLRIQFSWK